jgi:hypothetical protein
VNTNWPFIGPFLKFLECIGIIKELGTITGKQKRKMLSPQIFTLLYILKIIVGIPRIRGSEALLGDMGAMKMMGFDIDQLMNGLCERGDANQHGKGYKKNANHFLCLTLLDMNPLGALASQAQKYGKSVQAHYLPHHNS